MEDSPAPVTLGESLAHVSRAKRWTAAVFCPICMPVGLTLLLVHVYRSYYSPSFFRSVPWRLPLLLSWSSYMSLIFMVKSYAELFLPRTPVAVVEKIKYIGWWGIGFCVIGLMVSAVLASEVKDTRVLAGCFSLVTTFIVGLVAVWVWLARTYAGGGGGGGNALESSTTMTPDADESSMSIYQLC